MWRGTRANYNAIGVSGGSEAYDYWTEYNVKEIDGTWRKFYGTKEVTGDVGELRPVKSIITPTELSGLTSEQMAQGTRYLVGSGNSYYIVEFGPTPGIKSTKIEPLGSYSVRVENEGLKTYMFINGILDTYDHGLIHDCGSY